MGNMPSPAELVRKFWQSGVRIDPPIPRRIPAYSAPTYKQAVQAAMKKALNNFTPPNSEEIKLDFGKSTSDFNFGQTKVGGVADVSYGGWFSFSANADYESTSETLDTRDESSEVSIKMLYDTIQRIPITPGLWYVLPKALPFPILLFCYNETAYPLRLVCAGMRTCPNINSGATLQTTAKLLLLSPTLSS